MENSDPSTQRSPDIFVCAGEASGDLIASLMIKQIKRQAPELRIVGHGGDQMAEAGAEIIVNMVRDFAIIGLTEVITNFNKIQKLFRSTVAYLREHRPKVLVLIDYPGFNLRLAKVAHELGIKVVYYVIPQVWAWHKSRVHKLRRYVDLCLVIFPFEEKLLQNYKANVHYAGHPLLDVMILTMNREEVFQKFEFDPAKKLIGLLPGSRKREIESLLPVMLEAAERIQAQMPETQFVIPRAASVRIEHINRHLANYSVNVKVVDSFRYNVRSTMDFALVASGTATLETGLLLCPMLILYKTSWLTWFLGKMLVNIPYIGLINIVAGDMVVPELLQDQCTAMNTAERTLQILNDPQEVARIKYQLSRVKEKMGGRGASRVSAEKIIELCKSCGAGA